MDYKDETLKEIKNSKEKSLWLQQKKLVQKKTKKGIIKDKTKLFKKKTKKFNLKASRNER